MHSVEGGGDMSSSLRASFTHQLDYSVRSGEPFEKLLPYPGVGVFFVLFVFLFFFSIMSNAISEISCTEL